MALNPVMLQKEMGTWSNLVNWSTASFPTRASPTKSTRSGWLRLMSFESALISGSLSCKIHAPQKVNKMREPKRVDFHFTDEERVDLHPASGVNEDNVGVVAGGLLDRLLGHNRWVLLISLLEYRHLRKRAAPHASRKRKSRHGVSSGGYDAATWSARRPPLSHFTKKFQGGTYIYFYI